ncbi:hypothetical protein RvY_06717 [Ramazzottius varieornatus]|uniref:RIIa domain-containing protein n=1 Tax=Ramazzottius varieornatus TaxID=947166 RepID=A0A1D1V2E4_RAMVA|nr:hypothetical protein RvY_06717 [Ramazzottius varieornatus]
MDEKNLRKLDEPFYTAEQIIVPPELPEILKQFTKAAIKTQPPDLLEWSASYFRARATGQKLPVKDRLEMIPDDYDDLTLGLLKILHRELGHNNVADLAEIKEHWVGLGLSPDKFDELVQFGQLPGTAEWNRFIAVACTKLADHVEDIFSHYCMVLTNEPEGNNASVPLTLFREAYEYVADLIFHVDRKIQETFIVYMAEVADRQDGMVSPADFNYRECPTMHLPRGFPPVDEDMGQQRGDTTTETDTDKTSGTYSIP